MGDTEPVSDVGQKRRSAFANWLVEKSLSLLPIGTLVLGVILANLYSAVFKPVLVVLHFPDFDKSVDVTASSRAVSIAAKSYGEISNAFTSAQGIIDVFVPTPRTYHEIRKANRDVLSGFTCYETEYYDPYVSQAVYPVACPHFTNELVDKTLGSTEDSFSSLMFVDRQSTSGYFQPTQQFGLDRSAVRESQFYGSHQSMLAALDEAAAADDCRIGFTNQTEVENFAAKKRKNDAAWSLSAVFASHDIPGELPPAPVCVKPNRMFLVGKSITDREFRDIQNVFSEKAVIEEMVSVVFRRSILDKTEKGEFVTYDHQFLCEFFEGKC